MESAMIDKQFTHGKREDSNLGFSCKDTVAPSYVEQSSKAAGKVAEAGENRKYNTYVNLINA